MAKRPIDVKLGGVECCPELPAKPVCDTLDFRYRFPYNVRLENGNRSVRAEVILHFRLERCSGPLVTGDLAYTTTLMPGEKVRLFTSDRHTRWSYDSESSLSYRHETTSEESFFAAGMARSMTDITVNESGSAVSNYNESWAEGGGGASFSLLGIIEIGGGGGGGSYSASSISQFSRSLSRHAESSSSYVAASVRAKSATSVGEVERRNHAEGESEAQYESASRMFENPNHCHAVTYMFYKINKLQTVRFKLVRVERHIVDAAATSVIPRIPVDTSGKVAVIPQAILAGRKDRLEVEKIGMQSVAQRANFDREVLLGKTMAGVHNLSYMTAKPVYTNEPQFDENVRKRALQVLDNQLVKEGLLKPGTDLPGEEIVAEMAWEREEVLPTPGLMVKGCMDECIICEPALETEIELNLERKKLENKLLEKQIELLEKSREYRCCDKEEEATEEE